MAGGAAPEVVASGEALGLAQRWLGIKDLEAALAQASDPVLEPRPAGLGLGAKFLPHKKAAALTAPLSKRLEQAIRQEGTGHAAKRQRRDAAGEGTAQELGGVAIKDEVEEEQGRAGVFHRRPAAGAPSPFPKPQLEQQESAEKRRKKKKKKKKKRNKDNGAA